MKQKVKIHVRLSVWMDDTCQEEEEEVTKIIEPGNVSHVVCPTYNNYRSIIIVTLISTNNFHRSGAKGYFGGSSFS